MGRIEKAKVRNRKAGKQESTNEQTNEANGCYSLRTKLTRLRLVGAVPYSIGQIRKD
ncbi:MAG: hypothetical protein HY063_08865 [Bacteroidetes bacterium]|nr:hypothetical protein [Bacteroidota bacterium]